MKDEYFVPMCKGFKYASDAFKNYCLKYINWEQYGYDIKHNFIIYYITPNRHLFKCHGSNVVQFDDTYLTVQLETDYGYNNCKETNETYTFVYSSVLEPKLKNTLIKMGTIKTTLRKIKQIAIEEILKIEQYTFMDDNCYQYCINVAKRLGIDGEKFICNRPKLAFNITYSFISNHPIISIVLGLSWLNFPEFREITYKALDKMNN